MLDFRRQRRPRNFLGQREQRRLLALCVGAALVMFAMREAGRPEIWHWLLPRANADAERGPAAARPRARHPANIDRELLAGTFQSPGEPPPADDYFPGVRPDYLKAVRDDTFLRRSEYDAWFHLLELLSKTDDKTLAAASLGQVSYVQLDDQPKEYRGRLVTVRGTARQVTLFPAPKNAYGIKEYYQVTVLPAGGPAEPLIAFVLQLPPGFPQEPKLSAEVELTGFFFKRWAYQAQDRPRVAPLILARDVRWQPPAPPPVAAAPDLALVAPYFVGGLLLASAACALWYNRSRRRAAELRARAAPAATPALLQTLESVELAPSADQALERMRRPGH